MISQSDLFATCMNAVLPTYRTYIRLDILFDDFDIKKFSFSIIILT